MAEKVKVEKVKKTSPKKEKVMKAPEKRVSKKESTETFNFDTPINMDVLHRVVVMQNNNKRQGTRGTKTRANVRGGGKKPYAQKGTGQARHGSYRSPTFVGGGTVFGPHPQVFYQKINKKEYRTALRQALTLKKEKDLLVIMDDFKLPTHRTKELCVKLNSMKVLSALLVDEGNENLQKASRNIPNIKSYESKDVNVLDVLKYEKLIITKASLQSLVTRLS